MNEGTKRKTRKIGWGLVALSAVVIIAATVATILGAITEATYMAILASSVLPIIGGGMASQIGR